MTVQSTKGTLQVVSGPANFSGVRVTKATLQVVSGPSDTPAWVPTAVIVIITTTT